MVAYVHLSMLLKYATFQFSWELKEGGAGAGTRPGPERVNKGKERKGLR